MRVPLSWLREFVPVRNDVRAVAARLESCGFALEGLDADVLDIEVTANRPDCLSIYGVARETATAFELPLAPIAVSTHAAHPTAASTIRVSLDDPACRRYAVAMADVRPGPSPAWLTDRLLAAGIRPISNVVDVTNYVMIEIGHPLHAFDADRLDGGRIQVRRAQPGETLVTLDGQTRTLDGTMLVIADGGRPIALAGVMGGAASEVSQSTARIAIESAWFEPVSVRLTSKRVGLKTEASIRFERGADLEAPVRALHRTLDLLQQIGAGTPTAAILDVYPRPDERVQIQLSRAHLARLLGAPIPDEDVIRILMGLGFGLETIDGGWRVDVPSFRIDVRREADLIEDVGRHWGFDRVPATFPALTSAPRPTNPAIARNRLIGKLLNGAGVQEAVTFTFIERASAEPFAAGDSSLLEIANPLSEKFAVLRPSMLPGLVDALIYNRRRESASVRLFEVGAVFALGGGEQRQVAWVLTGPRSEHWSGAAAADRNTDFYDAKGLAEMIAGALGLLVTAEPAEFPGFVRGQTARLTVADDGPAIAVGGVGRVLPTVLQTRGLGSNEAVFGGWIDLDALDRAGASRPAVIAALPRHPSIVRDLSIVVDERLPAADVRGTIRSHAPATLIAVREFDRYQGPGVAPGQVSLSMRLTFRDPARTLTDGEVQQAVDAIVAALARQHGATIRGK